MALRFVDSGSGLGVKSGSLAILLSSDRSFRIVGTMAPRKPVGCAAGGGWVQVAACWNSCGGIGRKCAFYNGFARPVPTKFHNHRGFVSAARLVIWR